MWPPSRRPEICQRFLVLADTQQVYEILVVVFLEFIHPQGREPTNRPGKVSGLLSQLLAK